MKAPEHKPDTLPDARGHFGAYGGMFVAETLMGPLEELRAAYEHCLTDPEFLAEFDADLAHFVGRPSPLYFAERLSRENGGARIYLKRGSQSHRRAQDQQHCRSGAARQAHGQETHHRRKRRRPAGVATATVAARLGMECVVYMGADDIKRQAINLSPHRRLLGRPGSLGDLGFAHAETRSTKQCATG